MHGRLFVSRHHVCFSSNVFGVRTLLALPFREVVSVSKGTQSLINPSIVIVTKSGQHIFASFWKRDNAFNLLLGAWTTFHDQLWLERIHGTASPTAAAAAAASAASAAAAAAAAAAASSAAASLPAAALAAVATAAPLEHEVRLDGGGGDGGLAAAVGGGRCVPGCSVLGCSVLGCSLAEAEAALLADSSPFLAEFKAAQGGSAISVGAWQGFAGGGRVREVRFVQAVRSRLSPVRQTRVEETQQYSSLPCGRVVVQTHQVMLDTPHRESIPTMASRTPAIPGDGRHALRRLLRCAHQMGLRAAPHRLRLRRLLLHRRRRRRRRRQQQQRRRRRWRRRQQQQRRHRRWRLLGVGLGRAGAAKHTCTVATPTVAILTMAILTAAILARCGSRTRGSRSRS